MTTIPTDTVIDQQHLVSLAVVLACLVFVGTVYSLFSPKSPFVTAARLIGSLVWLGGSLKSFHRGSQLLLDDSLRRRKISACITARRLHV